MNHNHFVIQEHTLTDSRHWDLMLESKGTLITWQIPTPPDQWTRGPIECRKIFNHRLKYLRYNGPISNNRGTVKITHSGTYTPIKTDDAHWQITLNGKTNATLSLDHKTDDIWILKLTDTIKSPASTVL